MGIISLIVMGLIVGVLAKWVMPGDDPGGIIVTILLGIGGAFVGSYIGSLVGFAPMMGFSIKSLLLSTLGAVGLLAVYRLLKSG